MKILVIQLARLGDIFLMWPALRALRRAQPTAQIEVLTREKFVAALEGLEEINKIHILPTQELVGPLFEDKVDIKTAYDRTGVFIDQLTAEKYDWILNYTFSPVSSYITHAIAAPETRISGYTRHADGFLSIPDDISAYFYAQVGIYRSNRYHLCEIFATMASADLLAEDFRPPKFASKSFHNAQVAIHIGASEGHKTISPEKWTTIINQYLKLSQDNIVLIGAANEVGIAETILSSTPSDRVQSLVGKTKISDLFSVISDCKVLVGGDSAPMHIASLTGTASLNVSLRGVNFWETGPRAKGSCIIKVDSEAEIAADKIAMSLRKMRTGERQEVGVFTAIDGAPSFWALTSPEAEFQWSFIKALYTGEDFPASAKPEFNDGMEKLSDINKLMIEQMESIQNGGDFQIAAGIINRGEEIIETIGKLVPSLAIIVRWYQTEKIRLGPESQEVTLNKTLAIHQTLAKVCQLYHQYEQIKQDSVKETP